MQYQRDGLGALRSKWQGGNANKLSAAQRADLVKKLEQYSPEQVIAPDRRQARGPFWTVSDLSLVLEQWYGVCYRSPASLRRLLKGCGLSYQKVERVYGSQPDAARLVECQGALEENDGLQTSAS
jgi:transposase